MTEQLPLTPYAGTSGWKGSEASYARVMLEDSNGTTSLRQRVALKRVWDQEFRGLTWKDLGEIENLHAGQSSGVLSVLHKQGLIVRLKERRNRCSIYVAPPFVKEREVSPRNLNGSKDEICREILALIQQDKTLFTAGEVLDEIHSLLIREGF
jgi:hypothetical protein